MLVVASFVIWFSFCNLLLHTQTRGPLLPARLVTEACLTHLACWRVTGGPCACVKGSHLPVLCSGAATCSAAHLSALVGLSGLAADVSADPSESCFFSLREKTVFVASQCEGFLEKQQQHQSMSANERNG